MNKKIIAASLIAASTSMMAMDLQYFLGAGVERGNLNLKASVDIGQYHNEISNDASDTSFKLKGGIIIDELHRVSLSYVKFGETNENLTNNLINYDYLITLNEKSKLFVGVHAGKADYHIEGENSMSGTAYGSQVGGLYDITKNIQIELAAAYTMYNVSQTYTIGSIPVLVELEDSTSMSASINYKF